MIAVEGFGARKDRSRVLSGHQDEEAGAGRSLGPLEVVAASPLTDGGLGPRLLTGGGVSVPTTSVRGREHLLTVGGNHAVVVHSLRMLVAVRHVAAVPREGEVHTVDRSAARRRGAASPTRSGDE